MNVKKDSRKGAAQASRRDAFATDIIFDYFGFSMKTGQHSVRKQAELSQDLLTRAGNGDARAFAEIVRRYQDMVYSFSFKICRNREYAEETLQDTFINVYRKLKQFKGESRFSTWLYSIVSNNCLMKRRRTKLETASVRFEEHEDAADIRPHGTDRPAEHVIQHGSKHSPLDAVMTSELRERLDNAIQKLPVDYRLVFILRDLEEQSAEETAKIMHLSVPAVKSRLRRARVFLREQLSDYVTS